MAKAKTATHADLIEFALSLPGAWKDHPWGETVAKVGKKVFVFSGGDGKGSFSFSVKLPESGDAALAMKFAEPTGYGLGQRGWVSLRLGPKDKLDLGLAKAWVEESYRAIAPKKLVKELDAGASG